MAAELSDAVQARLVPPLGDARTSLRNIESPRHCAPSEARVLYLAHDLNDAAIWRRKHMLESAGARVAVAGFRRRGGALPGEAMVLGATEDGRLFRRVLTVGGAVPGLALRLRGLPKPDVILARNLEMLALAARARRLWTGDPVRVVYEVLDIHRMMLGDSARARLLRSVERWLCRPVSLVLVSSPGFVKHYFAPHDLLTDRISLVENKVIGAVVPAPPVSIAPGDVLTIGWFGILRCAWTLRTLDTLTRAAPGRFRVLARGVPALDKIPEFHEVMNANPDLHFGGPYRYPDDLSAIYGSVHLIWMADRYDAGLNSDWLLPNRLYEGGLQGRVPVGLEGTEIASFLRRAGIGIVLPRPEADCAHEILTSITEKDIARLGSAMRAVPSSTWIASEGNCRALLAAILGDPASKETKAVVGAG